MHPQISVLIELQNLDLSIGKIEEAKENYPRKVQLLKEKVDEERKITDLKRERLKELERQRRGEERKLEEETVKITRSEEKLLSVKSNKEYQAALKEIALAKESNSQKEENILNILEERLKKRISKEYWDTL